MLAMQKYTILDKWENNQVTKNSFEKMLFWILLRRSLKLRPLVVSNISIHRGLLIGNNKVLKINKTSETKLIFHLHELKTLRYIKTTSNYTKTTVKHTWS